MLSFWASPSAPARGERRARPRSGSFAYWGWTTHEGAWRVLIGLGLPLVAATIWGVFRVPGDPGNAPIQVSGIVRLSIELVYFGGAVVSLADAGHADLAVILGVLAILHYLASTDRTLRLLKQR